MKEEPPYIESVEREDKPTSSVSTIFAFFLGIIALFPPFPLHFIGLTPLIFNDSGKSIPIVDILIWTAMVFSGYYWYFSVLHKQFFSKNDNSSQGKLFLGFSGVLPMVFLVCYEIVK